MSKSGKTKYALLGVLSMHPASGYDIKKFWDSSFGFFWQENYGNLYPLLQRMEHEQLISRTVSYTEGKPAKNIYTVTDKGLVHGVEIGTATIKATSGSASDTCRVTVIPGRVKLTKAEKKKAGTIRLEWNKISSAEYYRVYRATSKDGKYAYIGHTSNLFYNDSKCKSGTKYFYKIRSCVKKDGTKYKGATSNVLSAKA